MQALTAVFGATWRYKPEGQNEAHDSAAVLAFWHEYLLPVLHFHRNRTISVLVSPSRDGRRLATILRHWNYGIVWGSSTRGGERALRESVEHLESGRLVAITPDGPQGPRRRAKRGAGLIAFRARCPLVAVSCRIFPALRLRSWDRFAVPLPFCTINISYSAAAMPPETGSEETVTAQLTAALQEALDR